MILRILSHNMRTLKSFSVVLAGLSALCVLGVMVQAQAPAVQSAIGEVKKVDPAARVIQLKTDQGAEITVNLGPAATFRRVAPGQTDLSKAETIALTDVAAGDRVLARGRMENAAVVATMIVVMSQGDLEKKRAAEKADWDARGETGLVTTVGADSVTITVRSMAGAHPVTITPAPNAIIRRYAPDSVSFAEAKTSALQEAKVGDQLRARGDKSPDGSKVTAVEIVSGTFKTIAGVVQSIDLAAGEMKVNDLDTKKPVIVKISPESSMRKLPPMAAQMIAARLRPNGGGEAPGGRGAAPQAAEGRGAAQGAEGRGGMAVRPGEGRGPGGPGAGGGGRGAGGDIQQVLDRSPNIALADLKAGDAIVVTSTVGATAGRMTAITLLAGVEPILTKPGTQEMSLGSWSLDASGGIGGF